MIRSKPMNRGAGFQRLPAGHPDRAAKPDRSEEFASYSAPRPAAVMATPASFAAQAKAPAAPPPKLPREARTDQRIRDSANGEECDVRLRLICNGRRDTTVWAHWPGLDGDRGMSLKAVDVCGAYACFDCHNAIDGRTPLPAGITRAEVVTDFLIGHMRSLVKLVRKGLL